MDDAIIHSFKSALLRGERPDIAALVQDDASGRDELLAELARIDREFQIASEELPSTDQYQTEIPELVSGLFNRTSNLLQEKENLDDPHSSVDTSQNYAQDSAPEPNTTSLWKAEERSLAPLNLNDYTLETKLGRGGQGDVYLARQRSLGRQVAIKLLKQVLATDPQSEHRFLREARTLAQAQHPQIVTIHGIGRTPKGELFLVMEYIQGLDLAKQIASRRFEIREAVEICVQVARAIDHAHSCGIIHRDLKPSNVLWDKVRGPVVTDFGLAKDLRAVNALTVTEQMMGTPCYMAPEQAHRHFGEISERTDVYGVGAILYALLAARSPIAPGPLGEVLQQLTSLEAVADPRGLRPEIPVSLSRICLKALAKYPRERFASCGEFSKELEAWLSGRFTKDSPNFIPPIATELHVPPTDHLVSGGQFGSYRLVSVLSSDQAFRVFRAEDQGGRPVLLKCLPPEWQSDRWKRTQFRQEVLLSCGLSHRCLAKVVEAGSIEGTEFLALEYIEGQSVAEIIAREGRLSERRAVEILQPISDALHQIHAAGIIYRDLRPQNILLVGHGHPMLADVRFSEESGKRDNATDSGESEATSKYVAPETLLGRPTDAASDVYTLGATLYAIVTGHEPFAAERDSINTLIAKNAARYIPPRDHVPNMSDAMCDLIAASLQPNPTMRPASAAMFAESIAKILPNIETNPDASDSQAAESGPQSENLLHAVWDTLDSELQDAFSLAFNKRRIAGSSRISTRDLFEALARLGTGPLKQFFGELPAGALPAPADPAVPIDRTILQKRPRLSDCVRDSLTEFRKQGLGQHKLSAMDLFVDVAKHGHGPSVIKLRAHGVDPESIERIVNAQGLNVVRRESPNPNPFVETFIGDEEHNVSDEEHEVSDEEHEVSDEEHEVSDEEDDIGNEKGYISDEKVQFTLYRPKSIRPEAWEPLVVFAHHSERRPDSPDGTADPIAEVQRQAREILGAKLVEFKSQASDSSESVPRAGELTFVPSGEGLEFNPPRRSFQWCELIHREEFRFRAVSELDGKLARGRLSVYLGRLLIAEINIVMQVDSKAVPVAGMAVFSENRVNRFRRIYTCASPADRGMVSELQKHSRLLGDMVVVPQRQDESQANPPIEQTQKDLIASASIFQLYWSSNALSSSRVEQEWRYALSLQRPNFIRSLYWEEPFPTNQERSLPPPELLTIGFQRIPDRIAFVKAAALMVPASKAQSSAAPAAVVAAPVAVASVPVVPVPVAPVSVAPAAIAPVPKAPVSRATLSAAPLSTALSAPLAVPISLEESLRDRDGSDLEMDQVQVRSSKLRAKARSKSHSEIVANAGPSDSDANDRRSKSFRAWGGHKGSQVGTLPKPQVTKSLRPWRDDSLETEHSSHWTAVLLITGITVAVASWWLFKLWHR